MYGTYPAFAYEVSNPNVMFYIGDNMENKAIHTMDE
ncbi:hypothetical protein M948_18755 [Virgibacillus sp. CM-4]|nr:hypothetical protein M948_18755 [Virgibacillus sp. CM-4]